MKRTALFFASTAILFSSPSAMAEQSPLPRPYISSNTNEAPLLMAQAEADPAAEQAKKQQEEAQKAAEHEAAARAEEAKQRAEKDAAAAAHAQQQAEELAKKRAEEAAHAAEAQAAERAQEAKRAAQEEAQKAAEQQKAIEAQAKQKAAEEAQAAKAAEKAAAQEAEQAKRAAQAEAQKAAEQQKAQEAEAKQKAAEEAQAAKAAAAQEAEQAKKAADKAAKEAPAAEQPAEKPAQPKPQKPAPEQPAVEKPAPVTEPAAGEKPAKPVEGQKPAAEQPAPAKPTAEKPAPVTEPAAGEKPAKPVEGQKPAAEQPASAKPTAEKPAPVTEPAAGEKPAKPVEGQKPAAEQPAPAKPTAEKPAPVTEPAAGEKPAVEKPATPVEAGKPAPKEPSPLPENAAPVLDSQKPAPPVKGTGGQTADKPAGEKPVVQQPAVQVPATPPAPPPKNDADVQKALVPVKIEPIRTEEGTRIKQAPREERPADVQVIKQIDNRTIVEVNNNIFVESSDRPRMSRDAQDVYYENLPRNRTRETIVRDNGVQVVTIRNRYGDVIQRSRVMPDGREVLLSYTPDYDREERYEWRDPGLDLPPLVLDIPIADYILDADQVPETEVYDFFSRPPVERVERIYSVDEVKRSARIRDKVRRIDLDTITFKFGSADITEDQIPHLDSVAKAMAEILKKNPAETFLIEGHTDAVGSDQANLVLSDKRAESVAQALTNVFGIPPENMATQGYGERYLKIKTDGPEQQNRRVAIRRITPLVQPLASK
ncbi:OmpA family protein [Phyllobacterium sp. 22229]|uniref:OmpA family protein n=1 Tax=Phyllobacterium sp. 22229 TaxID=3453895 RepID=UPI003F8481E2